MDGVETTLDGTPNFFPPSPPPLVAGIYTGRLRNNSERSERAVKEKRQGSDRNKEVSSKTFNKASNLPRPPSNKKGNKAIRSPLITQRSDIRNFLGVTPTPRREANIDSAEGDTFLGSGARRRLNCESVIAPTNKGEYYINSGNILSAAVSTSSHQPQAESQVNCNFTAPADPQTNNQSASHISEKVPSKKRTSVNADEPRDKNGTPNPSSSLVQQPTEGMDLAQIQTDEQAIKKLEARLLTLAEGSMERMLLEMQLDTKKENIKTRKMVCTMMHRNLIMQEAVAKIQQDKQDLSGKVDGIITEQLSNTTDINSVNNELKKVRGDLKVISGIMERQSMMIEHLQQRNENKDSSSLRNNLIIQGWETGKDDNDQDIKAIVTDFFSQTMKISRNIAIRSAMKLHSNQAANQVILVNVKDKGAIFKNVKNIVDVKNSKDESYYINDQLTYERQEEQRRFRAIKKANKELNSEDRSTITFKKGQLFIDGRKYTKNITFPKESEVINPESAEKIEKLYVTRGEDIANGRCVFSAISQKVRNFDDIRCGYIKARREFPNSLHIVCAFNLPGSHVSTKDFFDCGEPGAGRVLLELLTKNNITHREIFVAKLYGGEKLGPGRFDSYRKAAISAICSTMILGGPFSLLI